MMRRAIWLFAKTAHANIGRALGPFGHDRKHAFGFSVTRLDDLIRLERALHLWLHNVKQDGPVMAMPEETKDQEMAVEALAGGTILQETNAADKGERNTIIIQWPMLDDPDQKCARHALAAKSLGLALLQIAEFHTSFRLKLTAGCDGPLYYIRAELSA